MTEPKDGGVTLDAVALTRLLELLDGIDELAADSRMEYSNARGNDSACYAATKEIRGLLAARGKNPQEPKP